MDLQTEKERLKRELDKIEDPQLMQSVINFFEFIKIRPEILNGQITEDDFIAKMMKEDNNKAAKKTNPSNDDTKKPLL